MIPVKLIGNIPTEGYEDLLYSKAKEYLESFCIENNINKERQNYQIMFVPEVYKSDQEFKYKVGFRRSLCFYGKFYISPTSNETFIVNKNEYIFYPQAGDILVAFGDMINKTVTDKKATTIEFYIGSSSSLGAFDKDPWMPI